MKRSRGFTLIEVLVALVIVTFGVGALLAALSGAAGSNLRQREATLAQWIGFNQLSTTRLALQQPSTGTTTGEVDYANGRWAWEQSVEDLADIPGLRRITVKVRRAGDTGAESGGARWLASITGFKGDALNASLGQALLWNGTPRAPPGNNPGGGQGGGGRGGGDGGGRPGAINPGGGPGGGDGVPGRGGGGGGDGGGAPGRGGGGPGGGPGAPPGLP